MVKELADAKMVHVEMPLSAVTIFASLATSTVSIEDRGDRHCFYKAIKGPIGYKDIMPDSERGAKRCTHSAVVSTAKKENVVILHHGILYYDAPKRPTKPPIKREGKQKEVKDDPLVPFENDDAPANKPHEPIVVLSSFEHAYRVSGWVPPD